MGTRCKIKAIKPLCGVYPKYQPEVGKVYDANFVPGRSSKDSNRNAEFCVIDILDKRIVLRRGEFEVVG